MLGLHYCKGLSLVAESGAHSLVAPLVSGAGCFRLQGAWASEVVVCGLNSCGAQALDHRLNNCGARTWFLSSKWDLPGPGIEPVFLTVAGRFFTTEPPGKPHSTATFNGNEGKVPYRSIIPCLKFIDLKMFQILQLFIV